MIDPRMVCKIVQEHKHDLACHYKTLDILEGNLEKYVLECLRQQLSARVFEYARQRLVPINILPRYIDKLSNIYQSGVTREVIGGEQSDSDLLGWYVNQMDMNCIGGHANRLYNACKSTLFQPYIYRGEPKLRAIPSDKFVVYSDDPVNPLNPTMVILIVGKDSQGLEVYWAYTKDNFAIVKSNETIDYRAMELEGLINDENPYKVLPFIYTNSSMLRLCPIPDYDTLRIAEFIPTALTDLNLAAMFSAFSITHITNGTVENLTYAPNALWFLKSDDPDKDVQIGTLKPNVDYQEVLNLIQSELSLWFGSKGLKSQSVGTLSIDSAASGIAKMIDEVDSYEIRQAQAMTFSKAEHELWELILRDMHPIWVAQGMVENRALFSGSASVDVKFSVVPAGTARTQILADVEKEYSLGFTTKKRAISALNPQLSVSEIEQLMSDIDAEIQVNQPTELMGAQPNGQPSQNGNQNT